MLGLQQNQQPMRRACHHPWGGGVPLACSSRNPRVHGLHGVRSRPRGRCSSMSACGGARAGQPQASSRRVGRQQWNVASLTPRSAQALGNANPAPTGGWRPGRPVRRLLASSPANIHTHGVGHVAQACGRCGQSLETPPLTRGSSSIVPRRAGRRNRPAGAPWHVHSPAMLLLNAIPARTALRHLLAGVQVVAMVHGGAQVAGNQPTAFFSAQASVMGVAAMDYHRPPPHGSTPVAVSGPWVWPASARVVDRQDGRRDVCGPRWPS